MKKGRSATLGEAVAGKCSVMSTEDHMPHDLQSLSEFRKVNAQFPYNEYVKKWQDQSKKVVGWACDYAPEEVIHAAGMLPIRVLSGLRQLDLGNTDGNSLSYRFRINRVEVYFPGLRALIYLGRGFEAWPRVL